LLDIKLIRDNPEAVTQALLKRVDSVDFTELLSWDAKVRILATEADTLRANRNKVSQTISKLRKEKSPADELINEMQTVSANIKDIEKKVSELKKQITEFLDPLPNIPDDDVPAGGKENNEVMRTWREKPSFEFEPKDHIDLVTALNLIDYKRGVKLAGNGNWLYRGYGSLMEWGLLNYFVEQHVKNGYELVLPPHNLVYQCGYTAGQFPKFADDVYLIEHEGNDKPRSFLLPTGETALVNLHRDEILKESELPLKYCSYTPCYRKEAGSYRTNERGMIRGHQFNKVEMVHITLPEDSDRALAELLERAEKLVQALGLHYRVSKLAIGDCTSAMAKTYDIEVWIPSMGIYKEVSSASNARDYQARRGSIRFKRSDGKKTEFVHTLNASGLATSRLIPAIVEQMQQEDGSVVVPDVLRKWVGTDILRPVQ